MGRSTSEITNEVAKVRKVQKDPEFKTISIRVSYPVWRRLKVMQLEGKLKSIQQAVTEGLNLIVK